jgi:hypothetical protein
MAMEKKGSKTKTAGKAGGGKTAAPRAAKKKRAKKPPKQTSMKAMKGKKLAAILAAAAPKPVKATVQAQGPGAVNLELERFGAARKGVDAAFDGHKVHWLANDRSALIPVSSGEHDCAVIVQGEPGKDWGLRVTKPADASGGIHKVLPPKNQQPVQANVTIDVP